MYLLLTYHELINVSYDSIRNTICNTAHRDNDSLYVSQFDNFDGISHLNTPKIAQIVTETITSN